MELKLTEDLKPRRRDSAIQRKLKTKNGDGQVTERNVEGANNKKESTQR